MEKTMCVATLDSNLEKVEELETTLRSWKQRLRLSFSAAATSNNDFAAAEEEEAEALSLTGTPAGQKQPRSDVEESAVRREKVPYHLRLDQQSGGVEVEGAWHQLVSYMLELERRVREMEEERSLTAGRASVPATVASSSPHDSCTDTRRAAVEPAVGGDGERHKADEMENHSQALLLVFSYLSTAELCTVSQVCHKWRKVAGHPQLWQTVAIRDTVISSQDLQRLAKHCSGTISLTLHGLMPEMAGPDEELHSYISRQRGSLEPGLASFFSCAPQLTSLAVTECNLMVTERLLWLASIHCPQLKEFTYCSDEFPPTPAALWTLGNGCSKLQSLHLPPYFNSPFVTHFNDICLSTIAKGWPHLLQLTVGGAGITTTGLKEIVTYCPWLEMLQVEYGPQISSSGVTDMLSNGGLTHLHSLSFLFTPISPKALHQLSCSCPKLTNITLHISPNTYFPGSSTDSVALKKYHQIHSNFQELEQMPQMKEVFHLHHHHHPQTDNGTL